MFDSVLALLQTPPMPGTFVVVDQTGVGGAVSYMPREALECHATCKFCVVTITAGQAVGHQDGVGLCIPKKELVSVFQVLLQTRRLQIPRDLPEAALLVSELEKFKMKDTIPRTDQSLEAWRESPHDDLVLAVALAAWFGEQGLPPLYDPRQELQLYRPFRSW